MSEDQAVARVRRPRRKAETICQIVREFQASNLSQAEFCRRHAIPLSTFQWYVKKHRDEDVTRAVCGGFVAVEVARPIRHDDEKALAVILRGGRRIEVGIGFDSSTLAQIVTVLERI